MKKIKRETKPLFFLFTCVKDGRSYIKKLFNSLLSQTKYNFVHYIYEDGSSDPISDLVNDYKQKAYFEVIYEKNDDNIGLNKATQHCIEKCDCQFFIWIDCDNWIDRHFFEELEKMAIKKRDAILIRSKLLNQSGKNAAIYSKNYKKEKKTRQIKNFFYNSFAHGFFCVNKDYYLDINSDNYFFEEKGFYNDEQVILTSLLSKKKFYFCENAIGYFLERKDSESAVYAHNSIDYYFNLFEMLISRYDTRFAKQVQYIKCLRTSFNEMDALKKINPKKSFDIFFKRLRVIREQKIDRPFRYRRKNTFYWFLALAYCRIRYGRDKNINKSIEK